MRCEVFPFFHYFPVIILTLIQQAESYLPARTEESKYINLLLPCPHSYRFALTSIPVSVKINVDIYLCGH